MGRLGVQIGVKSTRAWLLSLSFLMVAAAHGQDPKAPFRIQIRHADPWAVKAMLEGLQITTPEISTLTGFRGVGAAAGSAATKLLKSGYLVVNPTDNSLWLFPSKS